MIIFVILNTLAHYISCILVAGMILQGAIHFNHWWILILVLFPCIAIVNDPLTMMARGRESDREDDNDGTR